MRVQYTREQGTAWDPKDPASIHKVRAAIDPDGKVVAYDFASKAFTRLDVASNESHPADTLAGQFTGAKLKSEPAFGVPAESYEFAAKRTTWETIPPLLDRASPLRSSHLRDPVGPQIHFASELFMDEVAAAIGATDYTIAKVLVQVLVVPGTGRALQQQGKAVDNDPTGYRVVPCRGNRTALIVDAISRDINHPA